MRTAIFFGAMLIANAISQDWGLSEGAATFFAIMAVIMMAMDVAEFIGRAFK